MYLVASTSRTREGLSDPEGPERTLLIFSLDGVSLLAILGHQRSGYALEIGMRLFEVNLQTTLRKELIL